MYVIVEIGGKQFKVEKQQQIYVDRIDSKEGTNVSFDKVFLLDDKKKVIVGSPTVSGAVVSTKILEHLKGEKVIVFKKKRRKGYKVKNGHRQLLTELLIEKISQKKSASAKSTEKKPKATAKPKVAAKSKKTSDK